MVEEPKVSVKRTSLSSLQDKLKQLKTEVDRKQKRNSEDSENLEKAMVGVDRIKLDIDHAANKHDQERINLLNNIFRLQTDKENLHKKIANLKRRESEHHLARNDIRMKGYEVHTRIQQAEKAFKQANDTFTKSVTSCHRELINIANDPVNYELRLSPAASANESIKQESRGSQGSSSVQLSEIANITSSIYTQSHQSARDNGPLSASDFDLGEPREPPPATPASSRNQKVRLDRNLVKRIDSRNRKLAGVYDRS